MRGGYEGHRLSGPWMQQRHPRRRKSKFSTERGSLRAFFRQDLQDGQDFGGCGFQPRVGRCDILSRDFFGRKKEFVQTNGS